MKGASSRIEMNWVILLSIIRLVFGCKEKDIPALNIGNIDKYRLKGKALQKKIHTLKVASNSHIFFTVYTPF